MPTGNTDEFTYTVTDADGDTSSATLTIEFTDANEPTASVSSQEVDEAGLDAGDVVADDDIGSQSQLGTESVTDTLNADFGFDGAGSISAVSHTSFATVDNGATLDITGDYWTLSVTKATGEYTFALTDNTPEHDVADTTGDSDQVQVSFSYTVEDSDGSTSSSSLTIDVNDDGPSAADDTDVVREGEGNNVSGNVIEGVSEAGTGAADTVGADGAVVSAVAHQSDEGDSGAAGDVVQGTYGFVTIAAGGG